MTDSVIPLEEDDAATLVASYEIVPRVVELDRGYDIRCVQVRSALATITTRCLPSVMSSTSPLSPKA